MKYRRLNFNINKETHPHLKDVTRCWETLDNKYHILYDEPNGYRHLRISRIDGQPIHNFMDMQEIKNDLFGDNAIAVEVYPKKSEFKDGSNTYHLWTWNEIKVPNLLEIYQYNSQRSGISTERLTVGEVAGLKQLNYQIINTLIKWKKLQIPTKTAIALTVC